MLYCWFSLQLAFNYRIEVVVYISSLVPFDIVYHATITYILNKIFLRGSWLRVNNSWVFWVWASKSYLE